MPKKFSSTYQPAHNGRKKGSTPTDWLRKLSTKQIKSKNPMTGKFEKMPVNAIVAVQLILKATQDSDLPSIKEYFDRIDGKVTDILKLGGELTFTQMGTIIKGKKKKEFNVGD